MEWNDKGTVVTIAIFTDSEDEYIIDLRDQGKALMGFINAEVEVDGWVNPEKGSKTITIQTYKIQKVWN